MTDVIKTANRIREQALTNTPSIDITTLVDDPVRLVDDTTALTGSQVTPRADSHVYTKSNKPKSYIKQRR